MDLFIGALFLEIVIFFNLSVSQILPVS